MSKKNIIIIGGGPASLMLACSLNADKFNISIYEKNQALARKFLVAGKGGFNLTHSENVTQFENRYINFSNISDVLKSFTNEDFRNWLSHIGIPTYVGTSKRVFPEKGIKPIEVLNAIEHVLKKNNVTIHYNRQWIGWEKNQLIFKTSNHDKLKVKADIVVFALGGASWKVTGSDGKWVDYFKHKNINTKPFYPSNCAYKIEWNKDLIKQVSGKVIKNALFSCGNIQKKGEAVITDFGIEGSGIYPLSPEIRKQLLGHADADSYRYQHNLTKRVANLFMDFKPELSFEEIKNRIEQRGKLSIKDVLEKKIKLSFVQIQSLKYQTTKEEYNNPIIISYLIKKFPLQITDFAPIDEAISTVGGIPWEELNPNFELKKLPNHFCIGEMIDWDAPTGGYLLQACFSMGKFVADKINSSLFEEGA